MGTPDRQPNQGTIGSAEFAKETDRNELSKWDSKTEGPSVMLAPKPISSSNVSHYEAKEIKIARQGSSLDRLGINLTDSKSAAASGPNSRQAQSRSRRNLFPEEMCSQETFLKTRKTH